MEEIIKADDTPQQSANSNDDIPASSGSQLWDGLLAKYVRVWIWSLLVGAVSGLSYAYVGVRMDRPWGALAVLPLALIGLGTIAALGAWACLLFYLRNAILPMFFQYKSPEYARTEQRYGEEWLQQRAGRSISQAYKFLLVAAIARLLLALSELMFEAIRGLHF